MFFIGLILKLSCKQAENVALKTVPLVVLTASKGRRQGIQQGYEQKRKLSNNGPCV
jgi:hypothetical protein